MIGMRRRRKIPELNTTSTADISFMLLTFFLVTSSMDSDKGLLRRLSPMPRAEEQNAEEMVVAKDNVMQVAIDGDNRLTCDGKSVTLAQLKARVARLAKAKPLQHIVAVKAAPQSTYEAYFKVQDAIVGAYSALRDQQARKRYGHPYTECSQEERDAVAKMVPQRISEAEAYEEGGLQ